MALDNTLQFSYNSVEQEIVCGPDSISGMNASLDRLGVSRPMVVCGPNILRESDVVQRVQEALGKRCVGLFSGVEPHSPMEVVYEAGAMAKELRPDALVSVGGGSTHDTCKGIAILLAGGRDLHDFEIRFEPPDKVFIPDLPSGRPPIISVPTTMGGAELTKGGGGLTDKSQGRKVLMSGKGAGHKAVIVDGKALATTPMPILVSTAIGQLRIAIESVYSRTHHPIGDAFGLHAIEGLVRYLPGCPERDLDCLLNTKTAALLASLAGAAGLGLNTAMAHQTGGLYRVNHGEANAILLPHTMRYNLDASAGRQALIAKAMGIDTKGMSDEDAGLAAADAVDRLCRQLKIPATLREVGVPEEGLELIAAATLQDRALATNPKPIADAGPIMTVLRSAW
jgi:alcohol dehydrogenase class IV